MHDHTVKISGDINFDTVMSLKRSIDAKIATHDLLHLDLSQVEHCDSSALALLIGWKRFAKHKFKKIYYENVPDSLISLANVCNVKFIFEE